MKKSTSNAAQPTSDKTASLDLRLIDRAAEICMRSDVQYLRHCVGYMAEYVRKSRIFAAAPFNDSEASQTYINAANRMAAEIVRDHTSSYQAPIITLAATMRKHHVRRAQP